MADDYYSTLGVSRGATAEEIRKAYRKLAKQNHPDRNPDDPAAVERYKQAGEAYAVLSDADKRKQYDRFGANYKQYGGGAGGGSPFGGGGAPFGGAGGGSPFGGGGAVDLQDLFGGGGSGFDLNDLFGGGGPARGAGRGARRGPFGGANRGGPQTRKGADVKSEIAVPFALAAEGGEYELDLDRGGRRETLGVKIPAGVPDGGTIRLSGRGEPSPGGGPAGDLLLTVKVGPHPIFTRDGANLLMDLPLTPAEAALGAKVDVPTLSGETVTLTIPPGTGGGAKLRLRGKGVPDRKTGSRGDQLVRTKLVVPKSPSAEQRELYERLRELDSDVRAGAW